MVYCLACSSLLDVSQTHHHFFTVHYAVVPHFEEKQKTLLLLVFVPEGSACLYDLPRHFGVHAFHCLHFWLNALETKFALMNRVWFQKGNCSKCVLFLWLWLFLCAIIAVPEDELRGRDRLCPLGD